VRHDEPKQNKGNKRSLCSLKRNFCKNLASMMKCVLLIIVMSVLWKDVAIGVMHNDCNIALSLEELVMEKAKEPIP